jgi:hypothetical protein
MDILIREVTHERASVTGLFAMQVRRGPMGLGYPWLERSGNGLGHGYPSPESQDP